MQLSAVSRPRVLLADDDEVHSALVATWLGLHGYEVVCFCTGDALLSWAVVESEPQCHAILLDVEMPGRDGFSTYAAFHEHSCLRDKPVAIMSGMHPDQLRALAGSAGVLAFPKDELLLAGLAAWLDQHADGGAGAPP